MSHAYTMIQGYVQIKGHENNALMNCLVMIFREISKENMCMPR